MDPHPLANVPNPFRDTVVADPWKQTRADVPEIQSAVFQSCCEALGYIRTHGKSTSILLHGEPGSGKTHLLSRIRSHWAGDDDSEAAPLPLKVVFVYVQLQTSPRMIWRHLRRCLVDDLLRPYADGSTQLERVLLARFADARRPQGDLSLWWDWLRDKYASPDQWHRMLDELFAPLDQRVKLGWELSTILGNLFLGRNRLLARSWLRGDPLTESALAHLGLVAPPEAEDQREDHAREVVMALSRLAGPSIPVVFCFDQIEALQIDPRDRDGLEAFAQTTTSLFQETDNTLLVSCIQSSFLDDLRRAAGDWNWARMAAHRNALNPLQWGDASQLIRARMDSQPELVQLPERKGETLWPLDEAKLKARVGWGLVARQLLNISAEMFDEAAGKRGPVPTIDEFLEDKRNEIYEKALARNSTEQADEILAHGLPLLVDVAARQWKSGRDHPPRGVDFIFEGPDGRVGVSLCNQGHMTSLAARLRHLLDVARDGKPEKLVLLRDVRLPISKGARRTRENLAKLKEEGACELRPTAEVLAALDVLRKLLSDAKAGDLAYRGETLAPKTVQEWLAANLPRDLRELLEEILSRPEVVPPVTEDDLFDRLMELLEERHVLTVEEAAGELEESVDALKECLCKNMQHFGQLSGPPGVLFQLVPVGLES